MSCVKDLYTFCIYCQLRTCIQFPSRRAMHSLFSMWRAWLLHQKLA